MTKPRIFFKDPSTGLERPHEYKNETMHFTSRATGNKRNWTDDEARYMLAHHKDMYIEDIAEQLDRTLKATKNKAARMGCSIKSKPKGDK